MKAEIITVGTEILLGQIDNTNATYLANQLATMGVEAHYQLVVGDNMNHIKHALASAEGQNDLIVVCGGLGPTNDDQTKEAVAQHLNRPLLTDTKQMQLIKEYFDLRRRVMVASNQKQAQYVEGATILKNSVGLALGDFYARANGADIAILPGPPSEMKAMFTRSLRPLLVKHYQLQQQFISQSMYFSGISESELMVRVEQILGPIDPQISIGSYVKDHAIMIRLTTSGDDQKLVTQLGELKAKIESNLGRYLLGEHPEDTVVKRVVELLKQRGQTITAAESLTGGLFQATICDVSGASNVFRGGFVTYANETKEQLLQVPHDLIEHYGVVSEPVAKSMAENCQRIMATDFGVSFTGVAGPDSLEGQPAVTVWVGIAQKGHTTITRQLHLNAASKRQVIRDKSVWQVLELLHQLLQ